jgi:glycosyltransferase involved in cell wall biosynthesis
MRIVFWHGYLLSGTGSNIYTQAVAREWRRAGHDVVVLCQEPHPDRFDLAGATVVRPDIGRVLPVFVLDRYEGLEARLLVDLGRDERERYVLANAAAVRHELPADLVFANHVVPGAPVAARSGADRFAVKVHGSELEYAMRASPELAEWAADAVGAAHTVFVGSEHIRNVLEELVGPVERVVEVPPGVDVEQFAPRNREEALAGLLEESRRDPPNRRNRNERLPDEGNAERLARFFADRGPVVLYVGKLLYNKGPHLVLEAMHGAEARALVVGFGDSDYRRELERRAPPGTLFTGALEHRHLVHLFPLADVAVVPSILPEAFGMVAAEAAAAGVPPLVARHSGLAEIAAEVAASYPPAARELVAFATGDAIELADRIRALLALAAEERRALGEAARAVAVARWSWATVARRLLEPFEG